MKMTSKADDIVPALGSPRFLNWRSCTDHGSDPLYWEIDTTRFRDGWAGNDRIHSNGLLRDGSASSIAVVVSMMSGTAIMADQFDW